MVQIIAAIFFMGALIAPLAIITLMLHQHWNQIVNALLGQVPVGPLPENRPARIRAMQNAVNRPLARSPRSRHAAA